MKLSSALMWIYFASGVCALIDEVIWVRLLKLTLGNTVYASCVVVSVFMGGLALGALLMGRYVERIRAPLRWYAALEVVVALAALLSPLALQLADGAYVWFYNAYQPSNTQLLAVQTIISGLLLLIPTVLMGSTLPLLSQHVAALGAGIGRQVGRLYAINMLGAAAGTFLAGFVLIRFIGVMGTLYAAAALNLGVALAAWLLSRGEGERAAPPAAPVEGTRETVEVRAGTPALLLCAVFASGFISIGYEILWMRGAIHILGADTYVFSAVLTIYLLGNVIGAGLGSAWSGKTKRPAFAFGLSLALLGVSGLFFLPYLAWLTSSLLEADQFLYQKYTENPGLISVLYPLLYSALFFLVPSICMGFGFPFALQAWGGGSAAVGRSTGLIYGANTIGAVLAGILTGFIFIPTLGVQKSLAMLGAAGVALGCALLYSGAAERRWRWAFSGAGLALVLGAFLAVPQDLFTRRFVKYLDTRQVAVTEGVTTTVSVHQEKNGALWLCTAGMQVAGDRSNSVQRLLGHLGLLLSSNARRVLTVGFGTGETCACLAQHKLERVDCVEISPELVAMSLKHFNHINLGSRLNDEIRMIYMDAKNYLHLSREQYDLIMTDSINPKYFAENASLYTEEYFASAARHLAPGGKLVCWIPFTLPPECFDSILGTFMKVFPHTSLWYPSTSPDHFVLLVGSQERQEFSPRRIREALQREPVRGSLAKIQIRNELDLFSCYIGDENDLLCYLKNFSLNGDYRPFVEFSTGRFLDDRGKWQFIMQLIAQARNDSIPEHVDWAGFSPEERQAWAADYELLYRITTLLLKTQDSAENISEVLAELINSESSSGLLESLSRYLQTQNDYVPGYCVRGSIYNFRRQYDLALQDFHRVLELDPENYFALNNRGLAHANKGQFERAIADYDGALALKPRYYAALNNRGFARFRMNEFEKAMADYDEALKINPRGHTTHINRGIVHYSRDQYDAAVAEFNRALELQPGNLDAHFNRATAFNTMGAYDKAVADYNLILARNPRDRSVFEGRAVAYFHLKDYGKAWEDVKLGRAAGVEFDIDFLRELRQASGKDGP